MRRPGLVSECSVVGCERVVNARGYCTLHYQRFRRHGDPDVLLVSRELVHGTQNGYTNRGCRCTECREAHRVAYGVNHRSRALRLGPCSVKGCDGYQYAKGYCHAHYERVRTGKPLATPIHRRPRAQIFEPTRSVTAPSAGRPVPPHNRQGEAA